MLNFSEFPPTVDKQALDFAYRDDLNALHRTQELRHAVAHSVGNALAWTFDATYGGTYSLPELQNAAALVEEEFRQADHPELGQTFNTYVQHTLHTRDWGLRVQTESQGDKV